MKKWVWGGIIGALLAPASALAQAPTIQPGDWASTGPCTLGWAFDGSDGAVYFSIAAHCTTAGSEVMIADPTATPAAPGESLGRVAMRGSEGDDPGLDVALIRVRDDLASRVSGELRGHPGIPSGVISPKEAAMGDALRLVGWGTGFEYAAPTREQRQGVFLEGDAWSWQALVPLTGGDSGGPLAHLPTGKALGLNKGGRCTTTSTWACGMWGPSIAAIERLAQSAGLTVKLRVAGAPRPVPPASPPGEQPPPPAQTQQPPSGEQPAPQAAATSVTIKVGKASARTIKRKKALNVALSSSRPLSRVSVLLGRSGKVFAMGTATGPVSRGSVRLKPKRRIASGRYELIVTGTDDLGRTVRASVRAKVAR